MLLTLRPVNPNPLQLVANKEPSNIAIRPARLFRYLSLISLALLIIDLAALYLKEVRQVDGFVVNMLYHFFDVSRESNIPSLFSTLILFIATVLLFFISSSIGRLSGTRKYWLLLAAIFLFVTIDEAASIHEQFNKYGSSVREESGYLHYTWVIPYGIFAVAVGIFFIRFLLTLPVKTRTLFVVAGAMYAGSAIGFELLEGNIVATYGVPTVEDKLFCAAEEFLEMFGICIFIYALLNYIAAHKVQAEIVS